MVKSDSTAARRVALSYAEERVHRPPGHGANRKTSERVSKKEELMQAFADIVKSMFDSS